MFGRMLMTLGATAFAGAALADSCDEDLANIGADEEIAQALDDASPSTRRNLRRFIDVADTMNHAGYDALCRSIIEAVGEMAARGAIMTDAARSVALNEEESAFDVLSEWGSYDYDKARADAAPFAGLASRISSDIIMDADVRLTDGEEVGTVEGFLTENGIGVSHLIVGYGGFLGIGGRNVAVPVERAQFSVMDRVFFINATEAWLGAQPDWDSKGWFDQTWEMNPG